MSDDLRLRVRVPKPPSTRLTVDDAPRLRMVSLGGGTSVPDYTGAYEADALFSCQTFPTADKRMLNDFTVKAINYTEAPNASGGKTLTIGG